MNGESLTPEQQKLEALKAVLPEAFTEGKVDWEKLKATLGEDINFSNERYVLNWAGKSEAFKVLQAPTTKTLIPAKDESVDFDNTEHVFIEGENLEVLKVLQKSYFGKVKMIYIDPPYNTGNDSFIYPDKFSETLAEYEQRVGDKDEDGYLTKDGLFRKNSKENGQYHSNWLNMMMPRLYLAKNLLKSDGVIFISIDDNEVHNLRLLMNEIFGEENFVDQIIWKKRYGGGAKEKHLVTLHEYILVYAKNINDLPYIHVPLEEDSIKRYYKLKDSNFAKRGAYRTHPLEATKSMGERKNLVFPITAPSGEKIMPKRQWLWSKERVEEALKANEIEFITANDGSVSVHSKQYLYDENGALRTGKFFSIVDDVYSQHGTNEIIDLFGEAQMFSFPKPTDLMERLLDISCPYGGIVLDLFSGSGSLAHGGFKFSAKRKIKIELISIQLKEPVDDKSIAFKSGYKNIADIGKERARRAAKKVQEENPDYQGDLGFKVLKLAESNFKQWQQVQGNDLDKIKDQMQLFIDPVAEGSTVENMAYELMLKSGFDLNSSLEAKDGFYAVNKTELVLLLESATQAIIDAVIALKPEKVIALDKLFKGNDQLKTNTALQMKDAAITFKTI